MLRLSNLRMPLDYTDDSLRHAVIHTLSIRECDLLSVSIVRRSVDARNKSDVHFVLSVDLKVRDESLLRKKHKNLSPVLARY